MPLDLLAQCYITCLLFRQLILSGNLKKFINGKKPVEYDYKDLVSMATIDWAWVYITKDTSLCD